MSREDYQRAMADLIRSPALCGVVRSGATDALEEYALTPIERGRLRAVADHRGMVVNCLLYRASRLVGITRRLPVTVELLGPALREIFDAYLIACPDAHAEFDREAQAFAQFISSWLDDRSRGLDADTELLRATLAAEVAGIGGTA